MFHLYLTCRRAAEAPCNVWGNSKSASCQVYERCKFTRSNCRLCTHQSIEVCSPLGLFCFLIVPLLLRLPGQCWRWRKGTPRPRPVPRRLGSLRAFWPPKSTRLDVQSRSHRRKTTKAQVTQSVLASRGWLGWCRGRQQCTGWCWGGRGQQLHAGHHGAHRALPCMTEAAKLFDLPILPSSSVSSNAAVMVGNAKFNKV